MGQCKHYKNFKEVKDKINELWEDKFLILEEDSFIYKNVHQHIAIKCNICGEIYNKRINDLFHGYGCRKCSGKTIRDNLQMKEYISNLTNKEYELISEHSKSRDKALFKHNSEFCRNNDHLFEMKIHSFTNLGHRCPYCNTGSRGIIESNGNRKIRKFLEDHQIKYTPEYSFSGCKNKNLNLLLSFDIFIPKLNILIEYDGIQHFQPIEYFGGEEAFLRTKQNDKIKDEFAKSNNIKLLRINYKNFHKIDEILLKEI